MRTVVLANGGDCGMQSVERREQVFQDGMKGASYARKKRIFDLVYLLIISRYHFSRM